MLKKQAIEKDLIDLCTGKKNSKEVKSSLDALQNLLTPRIPVGVGIVDGRLAIAPGNCIKFEPGVIGLSAEYVGYNENGEFFLSPSTPSAFSGVRFFDGGNIVIIPEREAKQKIKKVCKKNMSSLPQLKRNQLGGALTKVKFMKDLVLYGLYVNNKKEEVEGFDLGDAYYQFIEDVLEEYKSLSSEEKIKYYKDWDLMAHGYDDYPNPTKEAPTKWHQKAFSKFKSLSKEVKDSFDDDVNAALLCRIVKDAIFCFNENVSEVNKGHTHYFNVLLDKVEALNK